MAILALAFKLIYYVCVISALLSKCSDGKRIKRNLKNEVLENNKLIKDMNVDHSEVVFASYVAERDSWVIVKDAEDWLYNDTIGAQAKFENKQQETGWMFLNVETKEEFSDEKQAYAAGLLEGYLTGVYIVEQYKEFYGNDICKSSPNTCKWLKQRIKSNKDWVKEQAKIYSNSDPYWHQVSLFYRQLEGIATGCRLKTLSLKRRKQPIDDEAMDYEMGVLLLNLLAEFWDLKTQYELLYPEEIASSIYKRSISKSDITNNAPHRPSCSVLIKYVKENNDIVFAHNAWHEYRAMAYRVLKNYKLNYHILPDSSDLIPGNVISMSSYAGYAASLDDFYLTSSGLAATETTLFVYDQELFRNLTVKGSVYEPIRVMVSNRLAKNGSDWTNIFRKHNSGTYNNEWMVVDYNLLKEHGSSKAEPLPNGVLTVLEQLPDQIIAKDQTSALNNQSYWASYNRAYYPEIFERTGASKMVEKYGEWFTHDKTPRAKIFRRDHNKVSDVTSMMELMRYNDYKNDPLAEVDGCDEKRVPAGAIANRLDLSDINATCSFSDIDWMIGTFSPYGALDAKVANVDSFPSLEFTAVAGPPHGNFPPFKWSDISKEYLEQNNIESFPIPKFKPIDEFNFHPIMHKWENTVESKFLERLGGLINHK